MVHLLGWHWEFLPSFFAKLVPGVDLVPFWTMAVANVYRKSKRIAVAEESREKNPALKHPQRSSSKLVDYDGTGESPRPASSKRSIEQYYAEFAELERLNSGMGQL